MYVYALQLGRCTDAVQVVSKPPRLQRRAAPQRQDQRRTAAPVASRDPQQPRQQQLVRLEPAQAGTNRQQRERLPLARRDRLEVERRDNQHRALDTVTQVSIKADPLRKLMDKHKCNHHQLLPSRIRLNKPMECNRQVIRTISTNTKHNKKLLNTSRHQLRIILMQHSSNSKRRKRGAYRILRSEESSARENLVKSTSRVRRTPRWWSRSKCS